MKISEKIKENKIFFVTFGVLMLVSFEYLINKEIIHYIDNYYFPLYVINYDCGFSSRLLIGAIISLIFGDRLISPVFIVNMLMCVYAVVCFFISFFFNNYLKKTKYEYLGIYTVFLAITPVAVAFLRFLGTLDLFWMVFVIASLCLVDKKGWRWLVPVFCVISLCIYELFVTTYLPVMAIAVFYQFVKKPCKSNFIYIALCAVIVGFASIYFLILGDSTMKMTSDEMVAFARSRLDSQGSTFDEFYLRSVFFWELPDVENYHGFAGYIKYNYDIYFAGDASAIKTNIYFFISNILSTVPIFYLFAKTLKKAVKPIEKFVYICCFSPLPFMFINLMLSTDTDRFAYHFLLATAFLSVFLVKEKDAYFSESYDELTEKIDKNKAILAIVGLSAARIILSGVRF